MSRQPQGFVVAAATEAISGLGVTPTAAHHQTAGKRLRLLAIVGALALLVASCRDGERGVAGSDDAVPADKTTVVVEMTEWEIASEPEEAPPGTVVFEVTNAGDGDHTFAVFKTDLPADSLPISASDTVDVTAPGIEVAGYLGGGVASGAPESLELSLLKGAYVLVCNVPGHYRRGQVAPFAVR